MAEFIREGIAILERAVSRSRKEAEVAQKELEEIRIKAPGSKAEKDRASLRLSKATQDDRDAQKAINGIERVLERRMPMLRLIARRGQDQRVEEPTLEELFSVVELLDKKGNEKRAVKAFIQAVCRFALQDHSEAFERSQRGCPRSFDPARSNPPVVSSELFRGAFERSAKFFIEQTQTVCSYVAFLSQVFASRELGADGVPEFCEKANAIISLNYDMVIEEKVQLLRQSGETEQQDTDYRIFYGTGVVAPRQSDALEWVATESDKRSPGPVYVLPLIKLHGSFNWELIDSGDDSRVAVVVPNSASRTGSTPIWPSFVRGAMTGIYDKLFKEAVNHLKKASKVVIIGTSFSASDRYLRFLLAEGIGGGELPAVEIVNYSPGDQKAIRSQWENNLGRLGEFLRPEIYENGFLDYVERIRD